MFSLQELADERQGKIARLESELDESTMELEGLTEQVRAMTDAHLSSRTKITQLESTKHELLADVKGLQMHQQEEIKLRHQLANAKHEIMQLNGRIQDLETAQVRVYAISFF